MLFMRVSCCRSASVVSVVSGTQLDIPAPIHWFRFLVYRIVVTTQFELFIAALIVSLCLAFLLWILVFLPFITTTPSRRIDCMLVLSISVSDDL